MTPREALAALVEAWDRSEDPLDMEPAIAAARRALQEPEPVKPAGASLVALAATVRASVMGHPADCPCSACAFLRDAEAYMRAHRDRLRAEGRYIPGVTEEGPHLPQEERRG